MLAMQCNANPKDIISAMRARKRIDCMLHLHDMSPEDRDEMNGGLMILQSCMEPGLMYEESLFFSSQTGYNDNGVARSHSSI
jgi:hypothetical protein